MIKLRTVSIALLFALVMLAGSGISERARAQNAALESGVARTATLEMVARAGFNKLEVSSLSGTWVPFRIMIANTGEPLTGRIVVRTESRPTPNSQVRDFIKDVQLPTGSRQFHEIPVYVSSAHQEPVILLMSGNDVIASASVKIDRFGRSERLEIAIVDTDSTTLNNITSTDIFESPDRKPFKSGPLPSTSQEQEAENPDAAPNTNNPSAQNAPQPAPGARARRRGGRSNQQGYIAQPTVISPEDLPRDFVSYDPLDVVVLGDAPLSQLTEDQARALRLWVASGGLLIATGAADIAGLRATGLDAILPVEVQGAVTSQSLSELTDIYGRFESNDPLLIISASSRPEGRILLGSNDKPLVAERDYGSGIVRFIAYNPRLNPYRGWGGTRYIWTDMLLPAYEMKSRQSPNWITSRQRRNPRSIGSGVQDLLFSLAEIEPPSANYFLLFLLSYLLIVGPLNYFVLRWMRRLELAWLTIPGVVILFTVVSVTVAQVSRGGSTIAADVSLVELHQPEGMAHSMQSLLIMPASKDTHELTFDGRNTFANPLENNNSISTTSEPLETERHQERFRLRVPMNTWTSNIFSVRSMSEGAQPLISMEEPSGGGSSVRVKNLGDAPITKAVYVSDAGTSDLFDLAPGEEREINLSAPQATPFADWYSTQLAQDSQEAEIFDSLSSLLESKVGGQQAFRKGFFEQTNLTESLKNLARPLIVGFVEKGPNQMSFSGSLKQKSKSLYVIHL